MKTSRISDIEILGIPKIKDVRGSLAVIEKDSIPFEIKRVYYLFDVPSDSYRGGHAHKELYQLLIALSGSFSVILKDAFGNEKTVVLNKPDEGLLIPNMIWREIADFSSGAICPVVASDIYKEDDYIRNLEEFIS